MYRRTPKNSLPSNEHFSSILALSGATTEPNFNYPGLTFPNTQTNQNRHEVYDSSPGLYSMLQISDGKFRLVSKPDVYISVHENSYNPITFDSDEEDSKLTTPSSIRENSLHF